MNIITLYWLIPAILFLAISFMVRKAWILPIIAANLIFFGSIYLSEATLLSNPKPIFQNIPMYKHADWSKGVKILWSQVLTNQVIYILVNENGPKLYSLPYDPRLADKLKRAQGDKDNEHTLTQGQQGSFYGDNRFSMFGLSVGNLPTTQFDAKHSEGDYSVDEY